MFLARGSCVLDEVFKVCLLSAFMVLKVVFVMHAGVTLCMVIFSTGGTRNRHVWITWGVSSMLLVHFPVEVQRRIRPILTLFFFRCAGCDVLDVMNCNECDGCDECDGCAEPRNTRWAGPVCW